MQIAAERPKSAFVGGRETGRLAAREWARNPAEMNRSTGHSVRIELPASKRADATPRPYGGGAQIGEGGNSSVPASIRHRFWVVTFSPQNGP